MHMMQTQELEAQLAQAQSDRSVFMKAVEELKEKNRAKRREWTEERRRLVRTIDHQTRANTEQLKVRGPEMMDFCSSMCKLLLRIA
jgi:hypothetical protein